MLVIKLPTRKPITSVTTKELTEILKPYYGSNKKDGYFIGAAIGPGWNDIVLDLHNKLVKEYPDYFIAQIKEKFATLRYYTGPLSEIGWGYIAEAEMLSAATCEECGRPGEYRGDISWVLTLCDYDYKVHEINKKLWRWQSRPLHIYWKIKLAILRRKRKKRSLDD
jgi:hypothetical protein